MKLGETELKALIQGGETNTVELKVAASRATEMAERLWTGNAGGGIRTLNPSRGLVFETSAYTVPPRRLA